MQTSENLYAHGLIDGVVPHDQVADILDRALSVLTARNEALVDVPDPPVDEVDDVDTWESVTRSRRPERPGVRRLLKYAASDVIPLNGTGQGESDPGLLIALATLRRLAVHLPRARTGAARPRRTRSGPERCGRPAAGCGSRPSCTCR